MLSQRFPFQSTRILSSIRFCHSEQDKLARRNDVQKHEDHRVAPLEDSRNKLMVQYWNEGAAIRKEKRSQKFPRSCTNVTDLLRALQSMRNLPSTFSEMIYFFKKRRERAQLIEQTYLPRRVGVLRADLAAAHFIVKRGGSIKFVGQQEWVGMREKKKTLPVTYIPGLFVQCIKAEGTELYYEGLPNLGKLKYLTNLSLKNLDTMTDWCLDWISKEYYQTLKHLDISGCVNVTHRGFSSFYRFECLETLNVEGISDSPEFKLACLMLLEVMPDLEIKGIDLDIPEKLELNKMKQISDSDKELLELDEVRQIPDSDKQVQGIKS